MNLSEWLAADKPALDKDERNRIVHESLGLSFVCSGQNYEYRYYSDPGYECLVCGDWLYGVDHKFDDHDMIIPDYHTWKHAGPLLEKLSEKWNMWIFGIDGIKLSMRQGTTEIEVSGESISEAIVMAYLETL